MQIGESTELGEGNLNITVSSGTSGADISDDSSLVIAEYSAVIADVPFNQDNPYMLFMYIDHSEKASCVRKAVWENMAALFPNLKHFYLYPTDTSSNSTIEVDFSNFPTAVKWVAFSEVTTFREGPPARVSRVRSIKSLRCLEDFYGATGEFDVSDSNFDSFWGEDGKFYPPNYDEGSGLGGLIDIKEADPDGPSCPVDTKGFPQVVHLCNNIHSPTFCSLKVAEMESGQTLKPADASGIFMSCGGDSASSCPSDGDWLSCVLGSEWCSPENSGQIS